VAPESVRHGDSEVDLGVGGLLVGGDGLERLRLSDRLPRFRIAGWLLIVLDDVNRVIRENLSTQNMQYVFVAKDAEDLQQRLVSDQASPMTYDADQPQEVLDEDKLIDSIPLGFSADKVRIVPGEEVFD
jgi:hypothetical protein